MGIRLSEDEAWARIESARVGILTTIRRTGFPVALPVWFAPIERRIYTRTPVNAAKVKRIRANPHCGFLVESGEAWAELAAVSMEMHGTVLDWEDPEQASEAERAVERIDERYEGLRPASESLPPATREHYSDRLIIRLDPTGPFVSWDNARIRLRES